MPSVFQQLLEPLLERDEDAIRAAIGTLVQAGELSAVADAVLQFALLAHAPSLHARSALLAVVASRGIALPDAAREALLCELAIYSAATRRPWSEPPIFEEPRAIGDSSDAVVLDAIDAGDRETVEAWLAALRNAPQFRARLAAGAVAALSRNAESVVVTAACESLLGDVDVHAEPAILRVIASEWTAADAAASSNREERGRLASLLAERSVASGGDVFVSRSLLQLDAAMQLRAWGAADAATRAVASIEVPAVDDAASQNAASHSSGPPVYRLARDFASWLLLTRAAPRLVAEFPSTDFDRVLAAAEENAKHGAAYEEWSLA